MARAAILGAARESIARSCDILNVPVLHSPRRAERWVQLARPAQWRSILDARLTFPTADAVKGTNLTCFNIGGKNFRLLAGVSFAHQEKAHPRLVNHPPYTKKNG